MAGQSAQRKAEVGSIGQMLLDPAVRSALVIAHPAHEVRVYNWLSRLKPTAYLFTTGSRNGTDRSRFEASKSVIRDAGASVGAAWNGVEDRVVYRWLLSSDHTPFVEHTMRLAEAFEASGVQVVVTDSWQLYNVAHDIVHVMTRTAAQVASERLRRDIAVVDYPVVPFTMVPQAPRGTHVLDLDLSEADYAAKCEAMRRIPLIAEEVAEIVRVEGKGALKAESFSLPVEVDNFDSAPPTRPYYEQYGEDRVRDGRYQDVIRWHDVASAVAAVRSLI